MADVAIQGEPGSFSHRAALQVFGEDARILASADFEELFARVDGGDATHGLVPVENTLAGSVLENLDLLSASSLHVTGETTVRVELCVVGAVGASLEEAEGAASHPVALRQCRAFFEAHPWLEPVPAYDTAGSVRDLLAGSAPYDLAIGSPLAADLYGGEILARNVEDDEANFTRFFVVAREPVHPAPGPVRTSLVFAVPHRPGSLHRALGALADEALDLTRLESRPIPGRPWEYRFYADALAPSAAALGRGLARLGEATTELRVFGSWAASSP